MNDTRDMILAMAERLFADLATPTALDAAEAGGLDPALWSALEAAGLPRASAGEDQGGSGLAFADVAALVRVAGRFALPAPLAETLLAARVLGAAGLALPEGALTLGPVLAGETVRLERTANGGWTATGQLNRLPWARAAAGIAVIGLAADGWRTLLLRTPPVTREARNWADEPRDSVELTVHAVDEPDVGAAGAGYMPERLILEGALLRTAAMAGAMDRVLEITLDFAQQRQQFGRPIAKFQAVQQQLAELASQVAASAAALDAAVALAGAGGAAFEIAAAKVRVGEAANEVTAIAHRINAAIGFSHEYPLHYFTRRLWAWRDEFGDEAEWAGRIGRLVAMRGGDGLWPLLTDEAGRLETLP